MKDGRRRASFRKISAAVFVAVAVVASGCVPDEPAVPDVRFDRLVGRFLPRAGVATFVVEGEGFVGQLSAEAGPGIEVDNIIATSPKRVEVTLRDVSADPLIPSDLVVTATRNGRSTSDSCSACIRIQGRSFVPEPGSVVGVSGPADAPSLELAGPDGGLDETPQIGDVVSLHPTASDPDGLLGQIVGTEPAGSNLRMTLRPVSITDVVAEGTVDYAAGTDAESAAGLRSAPFPEPETEGADSPVANSSGGTSFSEAASCSGGGSMSISGGVNLDSDIDFSVEWGNFSNPIVGASLIATLSESVEISGEVTGTVSCSLAPTDLLATPISLGRRLVFVAGIPVVLTPTLQFVVSADGAADGDWTARLGQDAQASLGIEYADGATQPVRSFSNSFSDSPPALDVSASADIWIGARIDIAIAGVPGPAINVDAGMGFTGANTADPCWTIVGKLRAGASLAIPLTDFSIGAPDLVEFETTVAEAAESCDDDEPDDPFPSKQSDLWGDPHYVSFDGVAFDQQAEGEFVMVESAIDDLRVETQNKHLAGGRIAVHKRVAVHIRGDIIEWIAGVPVPQINGSPAPAGPTWLPSGVYVFGDRLVLPDSLGVRVRQAGGSSLSARVILGEEYWGNVTGPLGNAAGDTADELATYDIGFDAFYTDVVPGWIAPEATRLISGPQVAYVPPAGPTRIDWVDPAALAAAEALCEANGWPEGPARRTAVYDVAVTGLPEFCDPVDEIWPAPGDITAIVPGLMPALETPKLISAGDDHTCTVTVDGSAHCWGAGADGQLGNGQTTDSSTPVEVADIDDVVSISVGDTHSCAATDDGDAYCWGDGGSGRLGNGTEAGSTSPVQVTGLTDVVEIDAGSNFTCARRSNGSVWCWGNSYPGVLGDGVTRPAGRAVFEPVQVLGLTDAVSLSTTNQHVCAVRRTGGVVCWGAGLYGRLGNGAQSNALAPVPVSGLTDVISVAAGSTHSCAVVRNGAAYCWGAGLSGKLGNGASGDSSVPVTVSGLDDAVAITAGGSHSCAIRATGRSMCWGSGSSGRLGNGSTASSNVPVNVVDATDTTTITAGGAHTCTIMGRAAAYCWGSGANGRLGNGSTTGSNTPTAVLGLT